MRTKKLHLIDDWRRVLRKAWSIRLALIAAAFGGAELALPYLGDLIPPKVFLGLSMAITIAAAAARIVAQPKMDDPWGLEGAAKPSRGTCKAPPPGWWCPGEAGHSGPCPAWPEDRA